jgi:xanthine dehydrogenase accessory factor
MVVSLPVWKAIQAALSSDMQVMLLYVLESKGSSPGRRGFCMAADGNGQMTGSIGGGMMEHKLVELSRDLMKRNQPVSLLKKQVHAKNSDQQSGMICSGEQTIWLYTVQQKDIHTISQLIHALETNQGGTLQLSPDGIAFENGSPPENFAYTYLSDSEWAYRERAGYKNRLAIIGGGHCSLALSKLMSNMDFYICIYDDRPALKTWKENTFVHEKHLVSGYHRLHTLIPEGDDLYIVIMTFGYRTDDEALRSLLHTECRYLGVLGSKSKTEKPM